MDPLHCLRSRSWSLLPAVATLLVGRPLAAQEPRAVIAEELRRIETYPFSDPVPDPILVRDARLYPYHAFDGYAHESEPRAWRVVRLENEHLVVFVLPEVGGKVWGAIEKARGEEFIYRNEVLKFRNIALRGPWTSGGIEFNFGVIGHTPATATPVDCELQRHEDGSVSCVVGAMDLPSRTHWRVAIHLPADAAYFETRAQWSNPTPVRQSYYNWMTGAAFAREDLELVAPGRRYLEHGGRAHPWPVDAQGRRLDRWAENTFGGHKSYHVVGELADFFGGYYHDAGYGFGHWAPYDDMPGQKLWLWALSREGGIWEDLLTDGDGQYVEFQAGRLLVQYAPGTGDNPIRQEGFEPYRTDRWSERWFPLLGLGGLSVASGRGALHVTRGDGALTVRVNAFVPARGTLEVRVGGQVVARRPLELRPLELHEVELALPGAADGELEVRLPELELRYASHREERALRRPFTTDPAALAARPAAELRLAQARELVEARRHGAARAEVEALLAEDPWRREALLVLAELELRSARYPAGVAAVERALQLDTYDAEANFVAGSLYRAAGDLTNAREALGWAARSMAYRAAAYTQLAEIALQEDDPARAARYAERALGYDRDGLPALQVRAIAARLTGEEAQARGATARLLELDPLHHLAHFERHLLDPSEATLAEFTARVGGEFPEQTVLELAIGYHARGRDAEAVELLAPRAREGHPLLALWSAYLQRERDPAAARAHLAASLARSPAFVFPFRRETLAVLEWAATQADDWRLGYYRALNLWGLDRGEEALALLLAAGTAPDHGPFYVARAHLGRELTARDAEADLRRAVELDAGRWQPALLLVQHLADGARWDEAAALARGTAERFPGDFNVELALARALLRSGALDESIALLERVRVLPSEAGRTSRELFEEAHLTRALARLRAGDDAGAVADLERSLEWPSHLGQGRPYDPDERLAHYLLAHAHRRRGAEDVAAEYAARVIEASARRGAGGDLRRVLALRLAEGAQAAELAASLEAPIAAGDGAARWVRARARGDAAELDAVREAFPELLRSPEQHLLEEALDLTGGER